MLANDVTLPVFNAQPRWLPSQRLVNFLGFAACASMLGFGYFLQHIMRLEPCPMCILQRIAIVAVGCVFLVAALHNPRVWGARIYGVMVAITVATGAALSMRHIWLQYFLPEGQEPACGMALDYMLEELPPTEVLTNILAGTGDCTEVVWTFLGLSIPAWTLVCFVVLGIVGVTRNFMRV
jgi:disulfide bond formation protein DsbB